MPTDAEAFLLQLLDGTPHAHLVRTFDDGQFVLNTDWSDRDNDMCWHMQAKRWIEWNGFGYYITDSGRDVARNHYREAVKGDER